MTRAEGSTFATDRSNQLSSPGVVGRVVRRGAVRGAARSEEPLHLCRVLESGIPPQHVDVRGLRASTPATSVHRDPEQQVPGNKLVVPVNVPSQAHPPSTN